ncbi:MAG TPA: type II secretion system protein [Bacillota bacterium]|nr:type II secretion system protein [Bacillota bacterium]
MPNKFKAEKGFTLLETIAAVAVAGLVIGILAQVLMQCAYTQKRLEGRVTAQVLGSGKLSELIWGAESASSGVFPEPYRNYRWTSRTEMLDNGMEKIELELEWGETNGLLRKKILQHYRLAE